MIWSPLDVEYWVIPAIFLAVAVIGGGYWLLTGVLHTTGTMHLIEQVGHGR